MGTCDKICPPLPSLIHHYPVPSLWPTLAQVLAFAVTRATKTRGLHALNFMLSSCYLYGVNENIIFGDIGLAMQTE